MKAIRGATTITKDAAEEVKSAVGELLNEIYRRNALSGDEVISIQFTNTADIRSYYPAKAAREAGFFSAPLFSAQEPEINGALPLCIRVMLLVENDKTPVHVYLRGAVTLRKDITEVINIALDGPAGGGKSTVSKLVANKLNILCLDTGAMYRACALKFLNDDVNINDINEVEKAVARLDLRVEYKDGKQLTLLNGNNVSAEIRKNEISMLASTVSALESVRNKMVELQREIAANTSCILDGRDIGTNVLPNAKYKFYLTASDDVRAERRCGELLAKGQSADFNQIKNEIIKRDLQDKTRKIAPLKQADDAIFIDSSLMTAEQVADFIVNKIQEKI